MTQATATEVETPLPKPEGLEGVVAASTALSHVFGEEGRLVYRGYDIHELAGKASFEEVAHLLWVGHLPDRAELAELPGQTRGEPGAAERGDRGLRQMPTDAAPDGRAAHRCSPRSARSIAALFGDIADLDEAIALAARFPGILAAFFRLRQGQEPVKPKAGTTRPRAISTSSLATSRKSATGSRWRPIWSCWPTTA